MSMLIESDWGDLECVLWHRDSKTLEHWYRQESDPNHPWYRTQTISTEATGPGCVIQSTPVSPNAHGDFQVVVPEGNNLVHYWRDNSNGSNQSWYKGAIISNKATGAGSMIQSTYGTPNYPGNFEVVVPETINLVHYFRDNSQENPPWSGGTIITTGVTGSAALIQSTYGTPGWPGNFEVVVPKGGNSNYNLDHYFRDNSGDQQWMFGTTIVSAVNPGGGYQAPSLIQSTYDRNPPSPANFEMVVVDPDSNLIHLFRDNSSSEMPWNFTATIDNNCSGPNALVQGNYGEVNGSPGNFEVITVTPSVPPDNYQHWYRINSTSSLPWLAGPIITSCDATANKLVQETSEHNIKRNLSPIAGIGAGRPAISTK